MTTMAKNDSMHMNINNLIWKSRPEEDFYKMLFLFNHIYIVQAIESHTPANSWLKPSQS